jgi:hypothetical protein
MSGEIVGDNGVFDSLCEDDYKLGCTVDRHSEKTRLFYKKSEIRLDSWKHFLHGKNFPIISDVPFV